MAPTTPTETPALDDAPKRAKPLYRRVAARLGTLSAVGLSALLGPLVLLALAGALWAWSGTAGSLATTLKIAAWALPADQQLSSSDVEGNLRQGGRIGQLQWQRAGLQVASRDGQILLDWSQLWRQAWPVRSIHLKTLQIDDQRAPQAVTPLTSVSLPLPLQLAWQVDQFSWKGGADVALSDVRGHYAFDGQAHQLQVQSLTLAQGRYSLQARLQAQAPMALQIDLQGEVQTPTNGGVPGRPLALQSSIQGNLSGLLAQLSLQAQLAPVNAPGPLLRTPNSAHLDLQAQIQPWQKQPLRQAQGQWQALDLAPLWPGAPQTRLQGQAKVTPHGQAWQLDTTLSNALPGAWDKQRLPLSTLSLRARYDQGLWQVEQAQAQMAGGKVQAQAQQTLAGWTGQLDLHGVEPAQVHTALLGPAVQGRLQAQAKGPKSIHVQADLRAQSLPNAAAQPTSSPSPKAGLQWEKLQLSGQWEGQTWDIESLRLQAAQALLEARFKLQPALRSVQGQMTLQLPGLQAKAQGSLAPLSGQGRLSVAMPNASQSVNWLKTLPIWGAAFKDLKASGNGLLEAQWQGGFEQADTPLSIKVQGPRLEWHPPAQTPWVMAQSQWQLQGTPRSVQAQLQTKLSRGNTSAEVQTHWHARRPDVSSSNWQGQIDSVQIHLPNAATATAAPWRLQLQQAWDWQARLDEPTPSLNWGPSNWHLQGPTPGTGRLTVAAGDWTGQGEKQAQAHGLARWEDVPLSWAQPWLGTDIQSDVLLQGQMALQLDQNLSLTLSAERTQGDVRVYTANGAGQRTAAGIREARIRVNILNENLHAQLNWDSEQLGQVQAQLHSQLSQTADGWQWPEQAPLTGSVHARLPQVGAWSVLAPPGWRVQGTLDARFDVTGTRAQPQWQGQLQAEQLAVRSAVQGIEFNQGQLQARLQGQTLILDRLTLRGAGAQGGELLASGQVQFNAVPASRTNGNATANASTNPLRAAILALRIEAKGLRISNRADRRLVVSGALTANLTRGQLQLRGDLKADQALFILPEDSTPALGDDVVVIRPGMAQYDSPALTTPPDFAAPAKSWLGVPDVRVTLDLGPDFQLQGQGLTTRLAGQLTLVSNTSTEGIPHLTGQVRTNGGRYKAYGQLLSIETGVLRFSGPYNNPSLDIIALRPNLAQSVGVQITGTVLLPRVRLYAEPDLPDADKLAWLVLGRPAANGGAESAVLQQAAVALLSGNGKSLSGELASSLGLDEISLASGSRSDATATGAAVTLGKRVSKDFYLAYETSLNGAFGSLYIFYDLSRRLTLRAQAGEQSALDLIFTVRRD